VAGDVCVVNSGVYAESIEETSDGAVDRPIVYRSAIRHGTVLRGQFTVRGDYVTVDGFRIEMQNGATHAVSSSARGSTVSNSLITSSAAILGAGNAAIQMSGTTGHAIGNVVEGACKGFIIQGSGHRVESNEVRLLRQAGDCGDADYMRVFGRDHVISHNLLHGTNRSDVGSSHVDCIQNFDVNGAQYSLVNVVIEGNFCADADQGLMLNAEQHRASKGVVVRNNVFVRVGSWCMCAVDIGSVSVFNNTCDTTGGFHGLWCRGTNAATCEFKNNILYGTGSLYGVMDAAQLIDGSADAPGKNNLLFTPGATVRGYAADVKNQDPRFINLASGDYRVQSTSPAIDAGIPINAWTNPTDKDGSPRPRGSGWDIGAYECCGGPAPPSRLRIIR
jgi:hypothetical protein